MKKSGIANARCYGQTVSGSHMANLGVNPGANRDGKNPRAATVVITNMTTTGRDRSPVVPVE
jgi:hypothetical protein